MARILVVDDEDSVRKVLSIQLKRQGHEAIEAEDGEAAVEFLKTQSFQAMITDLKMPKMDGLELLQYARKKYPQIPVIMITAHGTIDTAVEAMKRGAFDYVTKPFNQTDFIKTVERAIASAENISNEFQRSRSFLRQEDKIIGSTPEMEKVYSIIEKIAPLSSHVLITGETGTGKEVVVRLIHDQGPRKDKPLVRVYLSATPAKDQDAILFGTNTKQGHFELAEDGTLYLDEITCLSDEMQAKLFDTLSSGHFSSQGSRHSLKCRVMASSHYNLLEKVENGLFRKDLFYCLHEVPIYLPPLRERTQDIEPLVDHFIKIFSKKFAKEPAQIDDEALFQLIQYPWPGNIRELENCMEFAVNIAETSQITKEDLPPYLFSTPLSKSGEPKEPWKDILVQKVARLEKETIEEVLKSSNGDILRAAQKLGIPPSLLEEKVMALKIK